MNGKESMLDLGSMWSWNSHRKRYVFDIGFSGTSLLMK